MAPTAEPRASRGVAQCHAAGASRIDSACARGGRRIVFDEEGSRRTTAQRAERLQASRGEGRDAVLLIGGPDDLDEPPRRGADRTLRLSDLTPPHRYGLANNDVEPCVGRRRTAAIGSRLK